MVEEENFNLNNPDNLNPIVNPVYKPLPQSDVAVSKEDRLNNWNEEVKNKGFKDIKAIDTNKRVDVDKKKLEFLKIMAFFGSLALLIIAFSIGYSVYKDGSIVPKFYCGNTTINVPDCSLSCGNVTCSSSCPECSLSCGNVNITCPSCNPTLNCDNSS